jgi:hypothetical protein
MKVTEAEYGLGHDCRSHAGALGGVLKEAMWYVKNQGQPAVVDVVTQNR